VTLELKGNAHPDLAGCRLQFTNPLPSLPHPGLDILNPVQRGTIGELTASHKVRVPAEPGEEFRDRPEAEGPPPERLANGLYLEWFSDTNGRVVIESTDYRLEISAPEWRMTPAEEQQRAQEAAAGWHGFVAQLNEAVAKQQRGQKDPEADWDEYDYEKFLKETDARTDKCLELQEKYGDSDEAEAKIAQAMGWDQMADATDGDDGKLMSPEEINHMADEALTEPEPEPDPFTEGKDWMRTADGALRHPLQHRCFESAMKFWHACGELGLKRSGDEDLHRFLFEFQTTGAKLAGALAGRAHGRDPRKAAFTVAYLKRALDHLHQAQTGLEGVAPRDLLPEQMIAQARQELFEIREAILQVMDEFRGRK